MIIKLSNLKKVPLKNDTNIFRIDTLEQFSKANLQWGLGKELPPFDDYFDMTVCQLNEN